MATHKPFREIVPPGTNFEFIGKRGAWALVSMLFIAASIGMLFVNQAIPSRGSMLNWTIDFKGGTEMIYAFEGKPEGAELGAMRQGIADAGFAGVEVSEFAFDTTLEDGTAQRVNGVRLRTPGFGAVTEEDKTKIASAISALEGQEIVKVSWSGDTVFVRAKKEVTRDEVSGVLAPLDYELRQVAEEDLADLVTVQATGEYSMQFAIAGLERQYAKVLSDSVGAKAELIQAYAVGAKAGKQLRNDGLRALFYAMALIMLYLAIRFDVRYAPGAVVALLHDAILVVGVFAATWTDVSLTTVAALLTVIGYSVNDTVVIFDRIRENVGKLKDKKFARVINISLNETLARTLLTSLTLFVVTLMMNIFGTGLVRDFAFAMNIGVIVGVYSSIFVASPVALWIHTRYFAASANK